MKESFISEESFLDFPAIKFAAGGYEALIIPGVGANIVYLKNTELDVDIVRTPAQNLTADAFSKRPQVYGIPVLFPPNRIKNGVFTIDGVAYHFPITDVENNNHLHGFLHQRAWTVAKKERTDEKVVITLVFTCNRDTDFFVYFPHEFEFILTYTLSELGLRQEIKIKNHGKQKMPVGLGFHTAINIPFCETSHIDDYYIKVSLDKKWVVEKMIPTGELTELSGADKHFIENGVKCVGYSLDNLHFTTTPVELDGKKMNGAIINDCNKNLRVVYEWGEKFKHTVIWNDSGDKNYICPEPQSWAINAPNLNLPSDVTGLCTIGAGETWEDYTILYAESSQI